ncbi:MAG: cytidylate kinase family protein, partial [Deltaproteobacteria bacterium]|nr:cytidylate kinase family protein [Deltaproteobacteria bacterium]
AALVARKLGLKLIGSEQIQERASMFDPDFKEACALYEMEVGPSFFDRIFFDSPTYTSLFESLTYDFASEGNVVLMGRGAQFILKDVPGVLKVRIVAPDVVRVERVRERYGVSSDEAAEMIEKFERQRKSLLQSMFKHDINDWVLYDLVMNTTHYDSDGGSDIVVEALRKLQKAPQPEHLREKLAAMALAKRVEASIKKELTSPVAYYVEVTGEPGGNLTVSGRIRTTRNKIKAEQHAKEFPGVASVQNELKVTDVLFGF